MKPDQTIFDYLEKLGFENNLVSKTFNKKENSFVYNPLSSENTYDKNKFKLIFFFYKDKNELFEQHKDLWNENKISVFIAINDRKSYIIDVKQKPDKKNPTSHSIKDFNYGINSKYFDKESIKELLKENIDNSYFWDYVIKCRKTVNEVDKDLLNNLVALHEELTKENKNSNYDQVNLLILQCLFVKYLEDRGVFDDNSILLTALSNKNDNELKTVFEQIKTINGDIFSNINFKVNSEQLYELAIFFEHDYREYKYKGQPLSLSPYKFDKIPIELISNVYEEFLGKTNPEEKKLKGVFYTRSFVVDFMLSHSVYEKVNTNKKITVLDPACGSGIFLVQSYKAILNQNPNISIDDKVTILQKQIFGIDIDKRALQIAAFSLYLALLASCTEDEIKERIEKQKQMLPNLIGKNLQQKNTIVDEITFFVGNKIIESFDCIVGNPPWGHIDEIEYSFDDSLNILKGNNIPESIISKLKNRKIKTDNFEMKLRKLLTSEEIKYLDKIIEYSKINNNEQVKERKIINSKPKYTNVSRYQRSQCFLLRINQWCNENTAISFIVNNSNFLNEDSIKFRKEIIQKFNILNYYDLSNITKILFKHANEPGSILIMDKKKNKENVIKYHTAQLTDMAKALKLIHHSSRDVKEIKQADLLKEGQDIIWKIFVNGNWDDYQLLKKKYFSKDLNISVECRSGFQPRKGMVCLGKPSYKKIIEPNDFEQYFILNELVEYNWNQNLRRRPDLNIFRGERLLIPLSPTEIDKNKIRGIYVEEEIIHKHNILSVKFKRNDKYIKNLNVFLGILNSKFIGYYLSLTSSQWKKGKRNTLRNSDIENLPFPNNISNNDQMKELTNLVKQIQTAKKENQSTKHLEDKIDEIVFDLYGLLDFEKEIIREFYDVNVHRKRKKAKESNPVDLQKYVDKFRDVFSFILDDELALNAEYSFQNIGAAVSFSIVKKEDFKPKIAKADSKILGIVKKKQLEKSLLSKAIKEEKIKIYNEENFTIIKSKYFKDWTVRQAMKDANEEIGLIVQRLPKE